MRSRNRKSFEAHGNVFFVTSTVVGFTPVFNNADLSQIFLENLRFYQDRGDFRIIAFVLMPEHFHLIIKVNDKYTVSQIMANLKRITSRQVTAYLRAAGNQSTIALLRDATSYEPARDSKLWKPRFDSLVLTNEETLSQKIEYIHQNPVKRGLVRNAIDWPCSSARNYAGRSDILVQVDSEWRCLGYDGFPSGKGS
jgi:putative transposase